MALANTKKTPHGNKIGILQEKLKKLNFCPPNELFERLIEGDPWALISVYSHIFFDYNNEISTEIGQIITPKIFAEDSPITLSNQSNQKPTNSLNTVSVKVIFIILKDIFKYTPKISIQMFQNAYLYPNEKIEMLFDVLALCDQWKKVKNTSK